MASTLSVYHSRVSGVVSLFIHFQAFFDLGKLVHNELVFGVGVGMQARKERKGFVLSALVDEPAWRFRHETGGDVNADGSGTRDLQETGNPPCPVTCNADHSVAEPRGYCRSHIICAQICRTGYGS
jgi:hypothetical protein